MRGEFIGVWSGTWREIGLPLIDHEGVPHDTFCEVYHALAPALKNRPSVEALGDIIDNPTQSLSVPKADIAAQGYDLSLNLYKDIVHEAVEHRAPKEIFAGLAKVEEDIPRGMKELEGMLK